MAYISLLEEERIGASKWWHKSVWKGILPLKIKCFLWLTLENKILTQDNYQKRGSVIVNCCILCGAALESMDHLLVGCPFTGLVWWKISSSLKLDTIWGNGSFSSSLRNWFHNYEKFVFKNVVGLVSWNI